MATLPKQSALGSVEPKIYETNHTNEDAPRDGKDLILRIDVGDKEALIHCKAWEKVGEHEGRRVIFDANKACTVEFDHKAVFGKDEYPLEANKRTPITVVVPMGESAWTYCEVRPTGMPRQSPRAHLSPPKIEVP
jgi:hypothetical protein